MVRSGSVDTAADTAGFRPATGLNYRDYLTAVHRAAAFDWYLEVGCRNGKTFAPSRSRTIAVDPFFKVKANVIGTKPALHVFQQTSDAFFASGFLRAMQARLSLSFLDGMHLFEYLLRDILNTEASSRADGVIALHDCLPFSHTMTTRDLAALPSGAWTGDVWKLIPILRQHRPDLRIDVLDCRPTGLVLLSGLDPSSTILSQAYDQILRDWTDVTLHDFGLERFYGQFDTISADDDLSAGLARFDHLRLDEAGAITPEYITP